MNTPPTAEKHDEKFALSPFTFWISLTIIGYIGILQLGFPTCWKIQFTGGLWPIILTAIAFHLFNAGFEFFFHRYVLHAQVFKFLLKFYKDHTLHHALTPIFRKRTEEETAPAPVVNRYPIAEESQYVSSFFPYWGLAGFTVAFLPLTVFVQWLLPNYPIMLGSFVAMTFSYCLYELLHALEHVPYESFWKQFVDSPIFGEIGIKVYGFHMFHHANKMANMAISGFFGLPVFDWLFGTYKQPRQILLDGTLATEEDFSAPRPFWLIRWLDKCLVDNKAT